MATLQDYQIQLQQLNELVWFLNQFKEDMNDKLNEYIHRIEVLRENGLPVQTAQRFEVEHIAETAQMIRQIMDLIDDRSLPFTRQNIELTENLIALNS
jgi:hemerythrin-like domain-containing protein